MSLIQYLAALVIGGCIALQAPVNNQLAVAFSDSVVIASLTSFFVGMVLLLILAIAGGGLPAAIAAAPSQPLWKFSGGILGVAYMFGAVYLVPRIGLASLLALVIAGQLATSLTLDHFGLVGLVERKITLLKVVGAVVTLGGVALMLFGDRLLAAGRG
ncbi:DMT family transporter [Xanthobacteraceae bacterium A53D]